MAKPPKVRVCAKFHMANARGSTSCSAKCAQMSARHYLRGSKTSYGHMVATTSSPVVGNVIWGYPDPKMEGNS